MHIRNFFALGAAVVLAGLAASEPAQAGVALNGIALNGVVLNGVVLNGTRLNGVNRDGLAQAVGLNFNALKLHAVVLPTGAQ